MAWPVLPNGWEAWQIEEMIGEGSYGAVYKAARKIGEDTVYSAIKIIHIPESAQEAKALEQELNSREAAREYCRDLAAKCMKEIRAMDSLKGITNIVSVEDGVMTENEDGFGWTIYIRMELLTCFTDYVTLHTLKEEDVIRMGEDLCTALSCCEKMNIIHRDIKPSNIFVSKLGFFKLGDFGVACRLDRTGGTFSSKGTSSYMAPEVFKCSPYDQRADIYSLGLVLYRQMNRNRDPFVDLDKNIIYAKDREEAMARRLSGEPLPPPADASPALARVILKACDPDPEKRYRDAASFRTALEQIGKPDMQKTGAISRWLLPGLLALAALIAGLWFFFGGRAGNCQGNPSVTEVPTVTETAALTETPTQEPAEKPTATPTAEPTPTPTPEPTEEPTAMPTAEPTPTPEPAEEPTATLTAEPAPEITAAPETPKAGISGILSGVISDLLKRIQSPIFALIPNVSAAPDDTLAPSSTPVSEPAEAAASKADAETAAPTLTQEPTATLTQKPTAAPTPTSTATSTPKATATPTPMPKVTATPTTKVTATPAPKPAATPTPTPEPTAAPTPTPAAKTNPTPYLVDDESMPDNTCTHPNLYVIDSREKTCTESGYIHYCCPDCGYQPVIVDPCGHDYAVGADGVSRCIRCGEPEPTGHVHQWGPKQLIKAGESWDDDEIYRCDCETCDAYMIITVMCNEILPEQWDYQIYEP